MMVFHPPPHIVWSTDRIDLSDPYQRRWYLRQVLTHGRAQDIRNLDLEEIRRDLEELELPPEVYSLWKSFLTTGHVKG